MPDEAKSCGKDVSIEDSAIANMNRLFIQNQSRVNAEEVWSMGKKLGSTYDREEKEILEHISQAEARDAQGGKYFSSNVECSRRRTGTL
ncbi:hypothetical protein Ancab_019814, partial [Ancistrocladus abbreviatus]